jgi:hypothetical protein
MIRCRSSYFSFQLTHSSLWKQRRSRRLTWPVQVSADVGIEWLMPPHLPQSDPTSSYLGASLYTMCPCTTISAIGTMETASAYSYILVTNLELVLTHPEL